MTDPIAHLFDDVETHLALCRPPPATRIEFDRLGNEYEFCVTITGVVVAIGCAHTLERAATKCRERFVEWSQDQQGVIEAALETTLQGAIRERHAGVER